MWPLFSLGPWTAEPPASRGVPTLAAEPRYRLQFTRLMVNGRTYDARGNVIQTLESGGIKSELPGIAAGSGIGAIIGGLTIQSAGIASVGYVAAAVAGLALLVMPLVSRLASPQ